MDKRYQVFVSSTYTDLKDERRAVIETLMTMDCIPAGMELFPAADEEQLNFIKRVIDDCDYYLLIIGGRYGSVTPEGVSFTEKEYDYALERGLKVVALLHGAPGDIPAKKTELDAEGQKRLAAFRDRVGKGRLVSFWTTQGELQGKVALSMMNAIKTYPAVGWMRADRSTSEEVLEEINQLRKEREELLSHVADLREGRQNQIPDLADMTETFQIVGVGSDFAGNMETKVVSPTWERIFGWLAPTLEVATHREAISPILSDALRLTMGLRTLTLSDSVFNTVEAQLQALGLIEVKAMESKTKTLEVYWMLTPLGKRRSIEVRVVRTKKPKVTAQ